MPSLNLQTTILLYLISTTVSSPLPYPQTKDDSVSTPNSTDVTSMAQSAALQASQATAPDAAGRTSLTNGLLAAAGMAPAINMKVSALSNILTTFEQGIATKLAVDTTESQVGCAQMTVIYARGTTEPGNGMMGAGAVSIQGVEYGATIEGFPVGEDPSGSSTMATMIQAAVQNCPNSKIIMAGYSQGGQLVHSAAEMLPAATLAKVNSIVIFGDPNNGQAVNGIDALRTMVICHPGDSIFDGGDLILVQHLTYSDSAVSVASFAASRARA